MFLLLPGVAFCYNMGEICIITIIINIIIIIIIIITITLLKHSNSPSVP